MSEKYCECGASNNSDALICRNKDCGKILRTQEELDREDSQNVIVTDMNMPFNSMVRFIFKWTMASIPTIIFVYLISWAIIEITKEL